jgi:hypothetical protein
MAYPDTPVIMSDATIRVIGEGATTDQWALIATWTEPEAGMCVHGIYPTRDDAKAATYTDAVREQYATLDDEGNQIVTEDVEWTVAPVGMPYLV